MAEELYADELQRALARPDSIKLIEQIEAYIEYHANGAGDWPDEWADDFCEIVTCAHEDPDRALAYIVFAAASSNDPAFLQLMGQSFEPLLSDPDPAFLDRIIAEAGKSARFRWLLSNPVKELISDEAWEGIAPFRFTGPHDQPSADQLPPRYLN